MAYSLWMPGVPALRHAMQGELGEID